MFWNLCKTLQSPCVHVVLQPKAGPDNAVFSSANKNNGAIRDDLHKCLSVVGPLVIFNLLVMYAVVFPGPVQYQGHRQIRTHTSVDLGNI